MKRESGVRRAWRSSKPWLVAVVAFLVGGGSAAPTRADDAFRCELKEALGVPEADGGTAARLICEELRRASFGQGRFGIALGTLGRVVVVTVTREDTAASVTVRLDGVEEVETAANRIADALVRGLAFPSTQRVDNLLEGEARPAKTKKGSVKFSLGVADVESPGHGARAAALSAGLVYSTPRFALPAEIRLAWDDSRGGEPGLELFSVSVGGRGYLSKRDLSPFLGAGLGVLRLEASEGGDPWAEGPASRYFFAERFGIAPYVEAGVEMLRLHRGRIALHVRADVPTWALESEAFEVYPHWDRRGPYPQPGSGSTIPAQSRYVVPVTIGVTVAF